MVPLHEIISFLKENFEFGRIILKITNKNGLNHANELLMRETNH